MNRLPRNPKFWLVSFILWFAMLWVFSSFSLVSEYSPPIDHFDKFAHFGYFFGGSGLLCAYLFRRSPQQPYWMRLIVTAVGIIALLGWLDEYHQSFTPGRSGKDILDWLADLTGATAGAFVFKRLHFLLKS